MVFRRFFSKDAPKPEPAEPVLDESESPEDDAGPRYQAVAELFADGGSDCRNLMDSRFEAVGIGFFQGLWTLDFTGP